MIPNYEIRFCTASDLDATAEMIKTTFMNFDEFGELTHMMLDGSHSTARPEHSVVAVEKATGKIVAGLICAPQTFAYAGLPLPVMNMEIVGTLPEHREKGLLRSMVDTLVERITQEGYQAAVVFGIAGLYRRFGFRPLLPYWGGRKYAASALRRRFPAQQAAETITLRPVSRDHLSEDLAFLARLQQAAAQRYLISFPYDEAYWKLAAFDYFERNRDQVRLIVDSAGNRKGALIHFSGGGESFGAYNFDLMPGISWLETLPPVMRAMLALGEDLAAQAKSAEHFENFTLFLGPQHPAYEFLADVPQVSKPSTHGYIRFCDLAGFLRYIAPVLEERIARSPICGYTREVKIELYYRREGLALSFQQGKLIGVRSQVIEGYQMVCDRADIEMPEEDFYKLITGQQSIDELAHNFREVNTWNGNNGLNTEFRILLRTLFPKQDSFINACV